MPRSPVHLVADAALTQHCLGSHATLACALGGRCGSNPALYKIPCHARLCRPCPLCHARISPCNTPDPRPSPLAAVTYGTLNISERSSVARALKSIDKANGYCFGGDVLITQQSPRNHVVIAERSQRNHVVITQQSQRNHVVIAEQSQRSHVVVP